MTILFAAGAAALFTLGTYLVLQRKLSRIIIGLGLLTHGANILLITSGRRGSPPIIGAISDATNKNLPLALVLVPIALGVGSIIWLIGWRTLPADVVTAAVEGRPSRPPA